jgi:hypothetical protein
LPKERIFTKQRCVQELGEKKDLSMNVVVLETREGIQKHPWKILHIRQKHLLIF